MENVRCVRLNFIFFVSKFEAKLYSFMKNPYKFEMFIVWTQKSVEYRNMRRHWNKVSVAALKTEVLVIFCVQH